MCMEKTLQELNLQDDFLFAKVMQDVDICKDVLQEILGIPIERVELLENQKVIDIAYESRGIRLDVYVQDEHQSVYNVEMQQSVKRNLPKRSRYYQGLIDLDILQKGSDYRLLNRSFVIFICTYDPFDAGRHIYTFEHICLEDQEIHLDDQTTRIFLNTEGTLQDVSDDMLALLSYIKQSTKQIAVESGSKLVQKIHNKVEHVKQSPEMEVEYMTLLERDREKKEEGIQEGIREGIREGKEKGIELTRKIFKLSIQGKSVAEIAVECETSEEEVEKILK